MAQVLPVHLADGQLSSFSQPALRRSSTSHTSFFVDSSTRLGKKNNYSYSDLQSASQSTSQASSSSRSTPASSLCLGTGSEDEEDDDDSDGEDTITLQAYSVRYSRPSSPVKANSRPPPSPADDAPSSPTTSALVEPVLISEDDTAVRREPSQHVDYLSHDWNEEDIWSSWRHIVSQRKVYGQRSRLENASWRTWAKSQFKLKTVSPETLNWLKDCDVTWLYGPLQPASNRIASKHASEPASRLSKTNSFLHHKKPILKKRSMSEVMLQNSLSASSLVKQAAAAVQAQQQQAKGILLEPRRDRHFFGRIGTMDHAFGPSSLPSQSLSRDSGGDYFSSRSTSGLQTPDHGGERKHIRFDDKVEQCIAVDCKDGDDYDDEEEVKNAWGMNDDDDSSDDGVVMMKRSRKKRPLSRTNSRASFSSGENKTIAKLPSTTLKYRTDSPDIPEDEQPPHHSLGRLRSSGLSPSASQETLRPSKPSANFLIPEFENGDGDDEEEEEEEEEEGLTMASSRSNHVSPNAHSTRSVGGDSGLDRPQGNSADASAGGGLRRTASGMFMPFEEQDQDVIPPGIMGKVVDTVNTARDIAHVIWNVGWRN